MHRPKRGAARQWLWNATCIVALLLSGKHGAAAQLSSADAHCRNHIGKGVSKLADTVLKEREKCHKLRMRGLLSPGTDCNDPAHSPGSTKIASATARLTAMTQAGCEVASSPPILGYLQCPPPCGTLPMTDYASVAACMACLAQTWASDAVELVYGTPQASPPDPDLTSCQGFVGLGLRKYLIARAREQQKCQLAQDRAPTNIDCRSVDLTGKITTARAKADSLIARCPLGALGNLDSCATDDTAEQACVTTVANWCADALFDAIYRPGLPTPTPAGTMFYTRTATFTPTPTATPVGTDTFTPTPSYSPIPTDTPTVTFTPTPLPPIHVDITPFPAQNPGPCLIFVHGKRTDTGTFTNWSEARNYWVSGSHDFIRTATKNFTSSFYVVGYNGTQAYWNTQSAGEVATEIVNATNGGADGGGNRCAQTYAQGGTFWVVAHSMGPSVMDYILGNADPTDPSYNRNGPYDVAAQRLSLVVSIAGTHRGSQGADLVCGGGNPLCSFFAQFVQDCDEATYWLQSDDSVQVKTYASPPEKMVWLTGGYKAIVGASLCLNGEDDGIVQVASAFACDGSATASYAVDNICDNSHKQEISGFKNLDVAHETHDEERNDTNSDNRVAIPSGVWICNAAACSPGSTLQGSMSTAAFVSKLY